MEIRMMRFSIFNTPVLKSLLKGLSLLLLKMTGWRKVGKLPSENKFVVIVAPHTSNWDLFYGILLAFAFELDPRFIAKHQLFRPPFSPVMKWLGGLPVDRASTKHKVDQLVQVFERKEKFVLALAPEGTRQKAAGWKSGFYHIAVKASVPIQLAFLDYPSKSGGAGPLIFPTGDIDRDMRTIRSFYETVSGKFPDKASPVMIGSKA